MSKWYEVKLTTVKIVAVEVPDDIPETAAMSVALNDAITDCASMDGETEGEIDSGPYEDGSDEAESIKRHADEVLGLPEAV